MIKIARAWRRRTSCLLVLGVSDELHDSSLIGGEANDLTDEGLDECGTGRRLSNTVGVLGREDTDSGWVTLVESPGEVCEREDRQHRSPVITNSQLSALSPSSCSSSSLWPMQSIINVMNPNEHAFEYFQRTIVWRAIRVRGYSPVYDPARALCIPLYLHHSYLNGMSQR